ncbi:MAG: DUF1449 family protein [Planctomicrobium sp.]|jgi:hypothetical protein|nr:DUF1449 family protein [Planctomicrobium sp.]
MNQLLEIYFQMPVLPFSFMLCMITLYWMSVILGGLDMDLFDIDLDFDLDADVDASVTDLGMLGLKWLNLGEVPFMLWVSLVTLVGWVVTMIFDRNIVDPSAQQSTISIVRSLGIGILGTKVITNPMRGKFRMKEPNTVRDMLGRTCSVVTSEVTPEFGNAIYHVEDGAPLRLNVRTLEGSAPKDSLVQIVDYAPETGIYYVQQTQG